MQIKNSQHLENKCITNMIQCRSQVPQSNTFFYIYIFLLRFQHLLDKESC
jgi:hypothetical protein